MSRRNSNTKEAINKEEPEVSPEPEVSAAPESEPEQPFMGQRVIAVKNKMRNPHTGAMFRCNAPTDVVDMDSKENAWTRSQIRAGVLRLMD